MKILVLSRTFLEDNIFKFNVSFCTHYSIKIGGDWCKILLCILEVSLTFEIEKFKKK